MQKFWIQTAGLILIAFAALYLTKNPGIIGPVLPIAPQTAPKTAEVSINGAVVNAEVADTPQTRATGLSGRVSLPQDSGMLFVFQQPGKYQFWMKGMQLSLDFIFIKKGQVVDLMQNIPPQPANTPDSQLPVYEPMSEIDSMLEVNGGFAASHNIAVGDQVSVTYNASTTTGVN